MKPHASAALAVLAVLALAACAEMRQPLPFVAEDLVVRAQDTVERLKARTDFAMFPGMLRSARGVVVLPAVVKAGFLGAAEVGNGVLLARGADGQWSSPAFYTLAAGSFGLQLGVQGTEIVMVLRSESAVRSILDHQGKLGADVGVTVGVIGAGMEASTTTNLGADVVAFANPILGAFGGASLEGAVLARRTDLNEAYYGPGATPQAIVVERTLNNPKADALRAVLASQ